MCDHKANGTRSAANVCFTYTAFWMNDLAWKSILYDWCTIDFFRNFLCRNECGHLHLVQYHSIRGGYSTRTYSMVPSGLKSVLCTFSSRWETRKLFDLSSHSVWGYCTFRYDIARSVIFTTFRQKCKPLNLHIHKLLIRLDLLLFCTGATHRSKNWWYLMPLYSSLSYLHIKHWNLLFCVSEWVKSFPLPACPCLCFCCSLHVYLYLPSVS